MKTKDYSMREMIIDQCLGTGREYTREELQAAVHAHGDRSCVRQLMQKCNRCKDHSGLCTLFCGFS